METIPTVVLYLASVAALIYSVTQVVSLIIALRQPKVVHRLAIRRQIGPVNLDLDFNLLDTDDFDACVAKTKHSIDMSGIAFEKVKEELEEENAKKRLEGPAGPYNDPSPATKKPKKRR